MLHVPDTNNATAGAQRNALATRPSFRQRRKSRSDPLDVLNSYQNEVPEFALPARERTGFYTGDVFLQTASSLPQIVNRRLLRHQYYPLPEDHIRLLMVHPGDFDDPIYVSMVSKPLSDAPQRLKYDALSYVWGDDAAIHPIYLFDHSRPAGARPFEEYLKEETIRENFLRIFESVSIFPVRKNLFTALRRLRKPTPRYSKTNNINYDAFWKPHNARVIWIDAICMNQKDSVEKNMQLPRMREIYGKATNVSIWLGETNDDSDISMDFVRQLSQPALYAPLLSAPDDKSKLLAFLNLMRNKWFGRRWIIQELFFAQNAAIYFGSKHQNWQQFFVALGRALELLQDPKRQLIRDADGVHPVAPETLNAYGATVLRGLFSDLLVKDQRGSRHPTKTLDYLICKLTPFDAGDPRDIMFGVYSLAKSATDVQLPTPDYTSSVLDVYTGFIKYTWDITEQLDIICRPWVPKHSWHWINLNKHDRRRVDTKLPSWMRTLEKSAFGIPSEIFQGRINGDPFVGDAMPIYNTSNRNRVKAVAEFGLKVETKTYNSQPTAASLDGSGLLSDMAPRIILKEQFDGTLKVAGQIIGKVRKRSDRMIPEVIPRDALVLGGWKHSRSTEELGFRHVPDRLWRTLIAGRSPEGGALDDHTACLEMLIREDRQGDIHIGDLLKDTGLMQTNKWLKGYLTRARVVCWNRRAFLVEQDQRGQASVDGFIHGNPLFGIGPDEITEGDIVCIIYGCSVPVILREVPSRPKVGFSVRNPYLGVAERAVPRGVQTGFSSTPSTRPQTPRIIPGPPETVPLFEIVGDCYLDGVMAGEAVDEDLVRSFTLV
jgi:hypothetical protein